MCTTCGCSDDAGVRLTDLGRPGPTPHDHSHDHDHPHGHGHAHSEPDTRTVELEVDLLAKNDGLAALNRQWLADRDVVALNLMSSPGSGKTTLLTRTIRDLGDELPCAVLEGDQETLLDAERIGATGAPVVQINTGAGCHLDADMVAAGLSTLAPEPGSLLFVENVGNLVCPALFDLGEAGRVVIMSVTEGADKPLKYPHMFRTADLMLVNKIDLLPHVDFDVAACIAYARRANPAVEVLEISATRGDGLDDWYGWLRRCAGH
ncbi:hydrogenase nickel incorporation protein HypB [Pseudonocardia alaniniphila]|uniref:Hydrogenase nickel incorporation protein HypB n=1 Tax=Pseudonocardia alaniniphila TaxID=75291 RepID=A0ABS9T7X0_9PSEU|nr:hydrogenase nickel incorporation protein HypB [Pseudonocardia alaniniphila]MCH6164533.1 hydrogenase nickel incorporation protein HypB [Pseudonocardia alaniniphila]